jgi:ATP phosphoribosyltransferase regulatory subunit
LLLDTARSYGFELVSPPLLEHIESLLTGTGKALDLQTFKLVDQISGRMMGLRADTTPQVARIDAHLLNRVGVTRLCYCGPVLHTRPDRPHATREPLQLGAEIYGHAGLEADLEVLQLALDCLQAAQMGAVLVDLADARIVGALLEGLSLTDVTRGEVYAALASKNSALLAELVKNFPADIQSGLISLIDLYGDASVLTKALQELPAKPQIQLAIEQLKWLSDQLPQVTFQFDLADARGYAYYSGLRFAIYAKGASDAVIRGGRYDGVGAAFGHEIGRDRPAVGFSLDLKQWVGVVPALSLKAAIRAPWGTRTDLRNAITKLRQQGETVVCILPGHNSEIDEFQCDRELLELAGQWVVKVIEK